VSAARAIGLHSSSSPTRRKCVPAGSLSAVMPRDGRRRRLWSPLAGAAAQVSRRRDVPVSHATTRDHNDDRECRRYARVGGSRRGGTLAPLARANVVRASDRLGRAIRCRPPVVAGDVQVLAAHPAPVGIGDDRRVPLVARCPSVGGPLEDRLEAGRRERASMDGLAACPRGEAATIGQRASCACLGSEGAFWKRVVTACLPRRSVA
jgi:hypothetical protein